MIVYEIVSPRLATFDDAVDASKLLFETAIVAVRTVTGAWPVMNVPTFVMNEPLL